MMLRVVLVLACLACARLRVQAHSSSSLEKQESQKVGFASIADTQRMHLASKPKPSSAFTSLLLAFQPTAVRSQRLRQSQSNARHRRSHLRMLPNRLPLEALSQAPNVRLDPGSTEELQREVLEVRSRTLGVEHPETLTMKNDLAQTLQARADLKGAEDLQRQVFDARVRILGPEHPDTLASKCTLARTLLARGIVNEAEKLQQEIIPAIRRNRQQHPSDTGGSTDIANLFDTIGASSEMLQREVLSSRNSTLGVEHPDTLTSKFHLAQTLRARDDLSSAEELHREVLNTRLEVLGQEHKDTLSSKSALAGVLRMRGEFKAAAELQQDVFEVSIRTLGLEHPETLESKRKLALILQDNGDLKGAEELQQKTMEDIRKQGGSVPACVTSPVPPSVLDFNKALVDTIKGGIDMLYRGRDIPRFYVLETVARVPYFAYLSCLHFYESLGMRGTTRRLRTHYAEADNELHHLLIMESLGGSDAFIDRFIAQHIALLYYWYNVAVYLFMPQAAYHLGELIEGHAFSTYDAFLKEHADDLRKRPVPDIARAYYGGSDAFEQYLWEDDERARPPLNNLYDVFVQIRNDEGDHWRTLCNLVQYGDLDEPDGCPVVATEKQRNVIT